MGVVLFKWFGILGVGAAVFAVSYPYSRRFLDWLRFQSIGTRDYIVEKLEIMFIRVDSQHVLLALFGLSVGMGGIVFLLFLPKVIPGILFGAVVTVVGWKAPKPFVNWLYRRRVQQFELQMVDALGLMANGMKSGLSVVQALGLVTQEMPNPIRQEFELILNENRLGVPLEECFISMSKRIGSDDVEMFVTSVNILKETGGNLAETFDTIVTTIRERLKVENKIRTITAQGFYQGMVVLGIPPGMAIMFTQADPEFMMPLFTTTLGLVILLAVLILEMVGFLLIMKIVKINV
jgi:tight adherence protein B